jgi:hypothetical protein
MIEICPVSKENTIKMVDFMLSNAGSHALKIMRLDITI